MSQPNPIAGSWTVARIEYISGTEHEWIDPAQPGLFLFTDTHYSMTWMPAGTRQPDYAQLWHPSDAEKVMSYNAIVCNAGQYELTGDILTTRVQVAKTPAFIGGLAKYQYLQNGDTLMLEIIDNVAHDGTRDVAYLTFRTIIHLQRTEKA